MNEPKPLASLSSGLLARKGQAAPAMRRQGMISLLAESAGTTAPVHGLEDDLGWNDMGHDTDYLPGQAGHAGLSPMASAHHDAHPPVEPVQPQISPIAAHVDVNHDEAEVPVVVRQQQALERDAATVKPEPAYVEAPALVEAIVPEAPVFMPKAAPRVANRAAPGSRGKSAFTLRLDAERHLQLRLLCAVNHRSAQQVVTDALDAYLASHPIAEQLAAMRVGGKA
jgi:hypothetical protein